MASESSANPNQPLDPYGRGFRAGCLLGCSPLLFLLVLAFLLVNVNFFGAGSDTGPRSDDAPPLPQIDPATPAASVLLPPQTSKSPVYLGDDLSCVPELMLEAAQQATPEEWKSRRAHAAALALHLNGKEEDGCLKVLLRTRPDLAGVPLTLGAACRTTGQRARAFKEAAEAVRKEKEAALLAETSDPPGDEQKREHFYQAVLAVAAQVLPVAEPSGQRSLVRGLASVPRPDATRALARVAVFSTEASVRAAAIEALAIRRQADATDVLVVGLGYPWPAVADNAATAIARLKRKDLVPQLERMLNAPDPRGPRSEVVAGREESVAHELVRVNHLRNCLLCHPPAERGKTPEETLVAEVPVPTLSLPDTSSRYGQSESNLLVRIDVTYLRQDFSVMQTVTDWTAESWPNRQRFDFFVRKRVLTPAEAADLRGRLAGVSPYQRAAARALRLLTGRDFELKPAQQRSR